MDEPYEVYCLVDPLFYDSPSLSRRRQCDFAVARRSTPSGWTSAVREDWLVVVPEDAHLPAQGWKIHVSARLADAELTGATVWDYCIQNRIAFKFVPSRQLLLLRNSKQADRRASGKFATIYPRDEAQLETVLNELGSMLEGRPGPYILSDLRWGAGPLYVRYGAFSERYCLTAGGQRELALENPDGLLVPDVRTPTFVLPPWVELPSFLAPHLKARNTATPEELPYVVEGALHFSNGGGVYRAHDRRTGEPVVLKEARPWAGLSGDGADAVERLRREREALQRLSVLPSTPKLRDHFTLSDHHFLVLEFVDGSSLQEQITERFPLTGQRAGEVALAEYVAWALTVHARTEEAVAQIHGLGVVIGDLHPSNLLVRENGEVVVIDLELAAEEDDDRPRSLGVPGFAAPPGCTGVDIDQYALACLRLHLFLPLAPLLALDRAKAPELAAVISELYPVPTEFLAEAVGVIGGSEPPRGPRKEEGLNGLGAAGWSEARDSLAQAILASATPDRADRLFPGEIAQFLPGGGLNLAHGAAGVLYALDAVGAGRYPEHEEWLALRAADPRPGTGPGLYDGLGGIAWVLDRFDRRDQALMLIDACLARLSAEPFGIDLHGGLAGIGLVLAHFAAATGDAALQQAKWDVIEQVANRLDNAARMTAVSGSDRPPVGLMRGASGAALLFIRTYEESGDDALLETAAAALRHDLARCVPGREGGLEVDEGWRTMPYLAEGSVGIGMVLQDYLRHREDEALSSAAEAIRATAAAQFTVEPGLFQGRAGLITHLADLCAASDAAPDSDAQLALNAQVQRLSWHALQYGGHLAFPGQMLMRLSMDLAGGSAGIMLALGAALNDNAARLPFLGADLSDRELAN